MAGNEIQVIVPVSIYHNWEMLEDYLVEHLSKCCGLDTFGCEPMLLAVDTLHPLCDPIHDELWDNEGFHLVIQDCVREVYEDHPKAIWVPVNESGILPAKAFYSLTRLPHVQVEAGSHTIERQAWRYCHSSPLSNYLAQLLQPNMLLSKGVMRLLQLQCQAVCPWGLDFSQNVAPSNK